MRVLLGSGGFRTPERITILQEHMREHFGPKMKTGPDARAFEVVSDRIDDHGIAFRNAAAQVASIDVLQSFMKDLRAQTTMAATN